MSIASNPRCKFGEKLSISDPDEFTLGYIRKQYEFAFEEIGDQLDDSPETIAVVAGTDYENSPELYIQEADKIRYCLSLRYMGHCTLVKCSTKKLMTELISESVSVQIN